MTSNTIKYLLCREAVAIEKRVTACLTADQWGLYGKPGAESAAHELNNEWNDVVRLGWPRKAAELHMNATMANLAQYGAADTEPRNMLEALLDEQFGEEE